jgi:hypothetical protein
MDLIGQLGKGFSFGQAKNSKFIPIKFLYGKVKVATPGRDVGFWIAHVRFGRGIARGGISFFWPYRVVVHPVGRRFCDSLVGFGPLREGWDPH